MPKRTKDSYDSDNGVVDVAPTSKKSKNKSSAQTVAAARQPKTNEDGDSYWELNPSGMRRATVNSYNNKLMVNLREYYEKDGKTLPGKKGISLPVDQFYALIGALPGIEQALKASGEDVPRPQYDAPAAPAAPDDPMEDDGDDEDGKKNFEATSSEDEG